MCCLGHPAAKPCPFLPSANIVALRPNSPRSPSPVDRPPLATTARSHHPKLARTSTTHPTCEGTPRCSCCPLEPLIQPCLCACPALAAPRHQVSSAAVAWTSSWGSSTNGRHRALHDAHPKVRWAPRGHVTRSTPSRRPCRRSQADTQSLLSIAAKPTLLGLHWLASAHRRYLASRSAPPCQVIRSRGRAIIGARLRRRDEAFSPLVAQQRPSDPAFAAPRDRRSQLRLSANVVAESRSAEQWWDCDRRRPEVGRVQSGRVQREEAFSSPRNRSISVRAELVQSTQAGSRQERSAEDLTAQHCAVRRRPSTAKPALEREAFIRLASVARRLHWGWRPRHRHADRRGDGSRQPYQAGPNATWSAAVHSSELVEAPRNAGVGVGGWTVAHGWENTREGESCSVGRRRRRCSRSTSGRGRGEKPRDRGRRWRWRRPWQPSGLACGCGSRAERAVVRQDPGKPTRAAAGSWCEKERWMGVGKQRWVGGLYTSWKRRVGGRSAPCPRGRRQTRRGRGLAGRRKERPFHRDGDYSDIFCLATSTAFNLDVQLYEDHQS